MWFVQLMPKFRIFLIMRYPLLDTSEMDNRMSLIIIMDGKRQQGMCFNNVGRDPSYKDSGWL